MKKMILLTADSNGAYPVPAVHGGAVPTLVEHLVQDNDKSGIYDLTVVSFYDIEAEEKSKRYGNTKFIWIKVPRILKSFDALLFKFIRVFFPNKKAQSYRTIFSLLFYIFKSRKILKVNDFDSVILENNIPLSLSLRGISSKYSGKYYYHFHNVPRINARNKNVISKAAGYLCVSDFVGKEIEKPENPIGPIPKRKISILRNCVDLSTFNDNTDLDKINRIRQELGICSTDKIIIFTGRMSKEKGTDKLIEAFKIACQKDETLKLLIVGSYLHGSNIKTKYQQHLADLSEEFKDKIIYTGYVKQKNLKYYYQIAKISVLPSMWDEPAGLTMLESMACGTPVITTNSGGIPEYLKDKAIILERDKMLVRKIALSIERLLSNPIIYEIYSQEGIRFVKDNYGSKGYMNRLQKSI
ncbi:glycosyltransferase family 4 protein [Companilactobacillus farciminis]|uniref:glycosyltransferase family 4 protein n=1 Tax=Companilactobacillus farciminis TaxID=1612 RepID=UPI00232FEF2F|nr:glycosyltransferase family 4 protein [Companilactobacillus farciminis]WCG35998.1 glycosyltransferase family 4 protein [Companilactobacillus farciminis]